MSAYVARYSADRVVTDDASHQFFPADSSGLDVKVFSPAVRHESAKTALDSYGHLLFGADGSTRAAINA